MALLDLKKAAVSFRCKRCNRDSSSCSCPRGDRLARLLDGPPISEEAMQVYRDEGCRDFYRLVACQIFGVAYGQTTDEQSRMARELYLAQVLLLA